MLSFLPAPVRGVIAGLLLLLNIMIIALCIVLFGLIAYIVPLKSVKNGIAYVQNDFLTPVWTDINYLIFKLFTRMRIIVHGNGSLKRNHWYFVIANHRSWADIMIMQQVFNRKIPFLKFFLKKELLWSLPLGGLACWMLGYPFLQRYSKAYLKKHPEMKHKDLETTQQACENFKHRPTSVMNFLEGTRFTRQKQQDRSSPYQNLLRPKAGGVAFVISHMKDHIKELIDVTVVYSDPDPTFWRFISGQIKTVNVHYSVIPLKSELYGDYYNDSQYRKTFQGWVNTLWQEKDKLISLNSSQEMGS
jgi:1-acyl-sn-glycerol-3-phosphate acyltransferase